MTGAHSGSPDILHDSLGEGALTTGRASEPHLSHLGQQPGAKTY